MVGGRWQNKCLEKAVRGSLVREVNSLLFENKLKGAQTEEDVSSCSVMRVVWATYRTPFILLVFKIITSIINKKTSSDSQVCIRMEKFYLLLFFFFFC